MGPDPPRPPGGTGPRPCPERMESSRPPPLPRALSDLRLGMGFPGFGVQGQESVRENECRPAPLNCLDGTGQTIVRNLHTGFLAGLAEPVNL